MAAPAPANDDVQNAAAEWSKISSGEKEIETIGVGLAGMNLVEASHHRRATESTMSSSPVDDSGFLNKSAPASPSMEKHKAPSPISKPPNLTLTPNSSDGTFLNSSFQNEGPAIPFLHQESAHHQRQGSGSIASYGTEPPDNDGLLGLEALRGGSESPRVRYNKADRPPLSQSYMEPHLHSSDRSVGGASIPFSTTSSRSGEQNLSVDSASYGAIGPGFADPNRRRASSHEVLPPGFYDAQQKFGHLPSLGNHFKPQQQPFMDRPRHIRSVSGPDTRYYSDKSRSHSFTGHTFEQQQLQQQQSQVPYRGGASSPNLTGFYGGNYGLERRDALDFQLSPGSQIHDYGGVTPSTISPGHSPHQIYYGSDSHGLSGLPPPRTHFEDDFTHPLVGESIEVPDQHDEHSAPYYVPSGSTHPLMRGPTHTHSLSLDGLYDHRPAAEAVSMPKVVYSVKFKRSQRNFILGPRINRDLKIGTYVKVEADRGEDLGIVVGRVPAEKFNTFSNRASFTAGMGPPGSPADLKRIIRLATHDEVSLLGMKREEEEELLKICRSKVRQRGLPMNVVDAEYQFDRHKLTFFFEAEGRVDFRELVRDLFSMYKTRIWMQQIDKNTCTSAQAIVAPSPNLQMDYGTPIIAPTSEFADSIVFSP